MQTRRGGEGRSRTLWESGVSPFKTAAFNRSATTPGGPNFFPISRLRNPLHLVTQRGQAAGRLLHTGYRLAEGPERGPYPNGRPGPIPRP